MILQVILVSTRPGRKGPIIADWFLDQARAHGRFEIQLVDLAEVNLPVFDEPRHPRLQQYEHEHTKAWSATVERADAFVFVTPEYDFGTPAPLVNALDYLVREWAYKAVGFVSYGGVSAGLRGVQMTKQIMSALRLVPVVEAVGHPVLQQAHRRAFRELRSGRGAGEGGNGDARRAVPGDRRPAAAQNVRGRPAPAADRPTPSACLTG